jgi:addiction module HigA family antidote
MMRMKHPAHPGEVLKELYLAPLNLTVTEAAVALGVTRKAFSELVNGRSGVSVEMALRLAKAFKTSPEYWLNMQQSYDLALTVSKAKLGRVKTLYKPTEV